MSLALARKYRPRNFAGVAVQSHVSDTLRGAIARGRVAHGYLLCGPRGTGKTTLARVLAMALNCENRGPDGEPCGECTSCVRIWSGSSSLDVVEIDAASNRGVDDARDLRERAMYAPSGEDRYKVYIVDEAHMLTREAWNALLKILEEPPPRVVFVFATTEPQKIAQSAAPVLSRLQRFDLKRIGIDEIIRRLETVLESEKIPATAESLAMIARAADGSMRDALSLTDQVISIGEGGITADRVREAHEQRLDEQLLLAALPKARLDLRHGGQHAQQIAGGEPPTTLREPLPRALGHLGRGTAQFDRELRAQDVRDSREERAEVDPGVGEARHDREHVARSPLGDDVEQLEELVLGNEAQRIAHALGGDAAFAHRQHLVGEAERIAHRAVGCARDCC